MRQNLATRQSVHDLGERKAGTDAAGHDLSNAVSECPIHFLARSFKSFPLPRRIFRENGDLTNAVYP